MIAEEQKIRQVDAASSDIQSLLSRCHIRAPRQPVRCEELDWAMTKCRQLIEQCRSVSAVIKEYFYLMQMIRLKWQRQLRYDNLTLGGVETDALLTVVEEADDTYHRIRATLDSPDVSATLIGQAKNDSTLLASEHYRYAFAALHRRHSLGRFAWPGPTLSEQAQKAVVDLADWRIALIRLSYLHFQVGKVLENVNGIYTDQIDWLNVDISYLIRLFPICLDWSDSIHLMLFESESEISNRIN